MKRKKESGGKEYVPIYKRYPNLPLYNAIVSLTVSAISLVTAIIVLIIVSGR